MPEGPEIRRVADRLQRAIGGKRLEDVRFAHEHLRPHESELRGTEVVGVTSRGKALITYFSSGRALYTHNQLYGVWRVCQAGKPPRTGRSLRVALETEDRWALLYSASEIEVLDAEDVEEHPFVAKLGPDLLDRSTTPERVAERLGDPRFARRTLGALLLDQGFLAGVGNYLRSEILYFAGVDALRKPRDLDEEQRAELARRAVEITRRAYRTGGLTEEPEALAAAKAAGEPRRSYRHAVFGRVGSACRRCGRKIRREEVAGRRLYRCTGCQRRR